MYLQKFKSYWRLLQPEATIVLILYILLGGFLANRYLDLLNFLIASSPMIFISLIASLLDTIGDVKEDKRVYKHDRSLVKNPLVLKEISREKALLSVPILILLFLFSSVMAWQLVGLNLVLILLMFGSYASISIVYSIQPRISDWSLLGNITFMAFLVYIPVILGSYLAIGSVPVEVIIVGLVVFLATLIGDITKDASYVTRDIFTSRKSLVKMHGPSGLIMISYLLPAFLVFPILLYLLLDLHIIYLAITFLGSGVLLLNFYDVRNLSEKLKKEEITLENIKREKVYVPVKSMYGRFAIFAGYCLPLAIIFGLILA